MTADEFVATFNRLCVALREPVDDSGITQQVYFEALGDLGPEALSGGAAKLSQERGRKFFPTTAEWRDASLAADMDVLRRRLPVGRPEPWRHECEDCGDTGWVLGLSCDGGGPQWPEAIPHAPRGKQGPEWRNEKAVGWTAQPRATETPRAATCGRIKPHLPHDYTMPCGCRATNHTYQRHQWGA